MQYQFFFFILETKKVKIDEPDHTGRTCLHHAVWGWSKIRENEELGEENQESLDIAKLLLEFGADPNFKDKSGSTPLSLACLNYRENCIKLLISYGGDINLANNNGETPFLCAVHKGYYECCLILYEQPDVNPYAKTIYGYDALELAIAHGRERLVSWVIKEKLENSKEYPGFELSKHDSKILLHHAVNNPKNNYQNIKTVFDYMYNYKYEELKSCFSDCFLRALLRNLDSAIKVFMSDEYSKLHSEIKFNEYILITSSFISSEVFSFVLERLDTDLPIVCLLVLIFYQSESLLSSLLLHPMLKFSTSDLSSPTDISFFMNYLTSDVLASYTYYPSLVHPFFSDESKVKFISLYSAVQLSVFVNNFRITKLLFSNTKCSALPKLKNGNNIIHFMVNKKSGDSLILQKLLEVLEIELGSQEAVCRDILMEKSQTDGLDCFEYCAVNSVFLPILLRYQTDQENDMYMKSKVMHVEYVMYDEPVSSKLDQKLKDEMIKRNENVTENQLILKDFWEELKIDLDHIQDENLRLNKTWYFIDNLEELSKAAEEMKKAKVLGVDLEFSGNSTVVIASLLQISTIECDYIVDALLLRESISSILTPIFGDENIVKVFHGCDYDVLLLLTDLEIEVVNAFDTARAYSFMERTAGQNNAPMPSFKFLCTKYLGIEPNKFFQVAEWRLRPVPKVMLNYCRADSHYLLYLYSIITKEMYDSSLVCEQKIPNSKKTIKVDVIKGFTSAMNAFIIQSIEKANQRNYCNTLCHSPENALLNFANRGRMTTTNKKM